MIALTLSLPVLLLLLVNVSGAATGPQRFVLRAGDAAATGQLLAQIYTEEKRRAVDLALQFGAEMTGNGSLLFSSHGQRRTLALVDAARPALGMRVSPANALWARWRWAQWTNMTLTLRNQRSARAAAAQAAAQAIFQCGSSERAAFCDAGDYALDASAAASLPAEVRDARYRVVIDPDRRRGALPPSLYFLLTNGRGVRHGGASAGAGHNITLSMALATHCVTLVPRVAGATPLRLCDSDVAAGYFSLQGAAAGSPGTGSATELRIGGDYWRATFAAVEVDGWAGTVSAVYAPASVDALAVQICGAVAGALTLLVVYGRWAASPETLSAGLFLWQAAADTRARRKAGRTGTNLVWRVDFRLVIGSGLLLVSAVSGTTLAWLAVAAPDAVVPPDGPDFLVLVSVLTGVGAAEALLATAAAVYGLGYARQRQRRRDALFWARGGRGLRRADPRFGDVELVRLDADHSDSEVGEGEEEEQGDKPAPWWASHNVPAAVAWIHHTAHGAAALIFAALALVPLSMAGGAYGDRVLLFLLVPPSLVLVGHLAYYASAALGVAHALRHGRLLTAASIGQLLVLLGVAAVVAYVLLTPLLDAASPLFSSAVSLVSAVWAVALAVVLALALVQYEGVVVLRKLAAEADSPAPQQ